MVVLAGLAAAGTHAVVASWLDRRQPSRIAALLLLAGAVLALVVAIGASHPVRHWQSFTRLPATSAEDANVREHFLSTNGNLRWQYWQSALDEFRSAPLLGRGTGSFEAWWSQYGGHAGFIGNAHSLYFETLGELGIVGFLVLAAAILAGVVASVRGCLRASAPARDVIAASAAGFVAFAVAAGLDWTWSLPAVPIVGLALLGLALTAGPTAAVSRAPAGRRSRALPVALVALAAVVLAAQVDVYLADARLDDSRRAVAAGELASAAGSARGPGRSSRGRRRPTSRSPSSRSSAGASARRGRRSRTPSAATTTIGASG